MGRIVVGRLPQHSRRSGQGIAGNYGDCNAQDGHDSLDQKMVLQLASEWTVSILCCPQRHRLNTQRWHEFCTTDLF